MSADGVDHPCEAEFAPLIGAQAVYLHTIGRLPTYSRSRLTQISCSIRRDC